MNASYTLQAPDVTTQRSFWRFALKGLGEELGKAYTARKVAGTSWLVLPRFLPQATAFPASPARCCVD